MKSYLSHEQIEDLLDYIGVSSVKDWKGDKIQFCCPIHGESHPSCGINADFSPPEHPDEHYQVFHCFEGNTPVITDNGVKKIKDLLSSPCNIINGNGEWESVQFKSYGNQRLWKLVVSSNGITKTIYTTSHHRWYVRGRKSYVYTKDLLLGSRLQKILPKSIQDFSLDIEGPRLGYTVKEVTQTDRVEEVYCCETSTHSFVLDGFILTGNCFSCGASGTLVWFLYKSLPDKFKSVSDAASFIRDRYKVSYTYTLEQVKSKIKRYSDIFSSKSATRRFELPMYELAPFKSGKETFQYFFDRGFTVEELKEYMIGRDLKSRTITFPIFWEDGKLAGIIGRYIDRNRPKNSRFKIYGFPKGSLIYPLDKVVPVDGTLICVESIMDCIALRSWGFPNAISTMGDGMSSLQANQISSRCSRLIALFDHDEGGRVATSITEKRLKNKVVVLKPTYYPDFGKDPLEWGELETLKVIRSAKIINSRSIPRL